MDLLQALGEALYYIGSHAESVLRDHPDRRLSGIALGPDGWLYITWSEL